MNDYSPRPIHTPETIPVSPPNAALNVVKVPQVKTTTRWPLYLFIGALILAILAAIPFVIPSVGTKLRELVRGETKTIPAPKVSNTVPQKPATENVMTVRQAKDLAFNALVEARGKESVRSRLETLDIDDSKTITTTYGWIFFWNSKAFLQTGDTRLAYPGTGPIVVLKNGGIEFLPTNVLPAVAIREYEVAAGYRAQAVGTSTASTTIQVTATSTASTPLQTQQ